MNKETTQRTGWDIVYLISCALHGNIPAADRIRNMDLSAVYRTAENHMLTAIVAMALETYWNENPPENAEIMEPWKQAKGRAVRKNLLLDAERQQVLSIFEENGIWYMPLKGSLLKELYPQYGMRQMADNDILFDISYRKKVLGIMKQRGYEVEHYGKSNHDVYLKQPVYNFEMHIALFGEIGDERWVKYYSDVKKRLLPDTNTQFGFHFSEEDFYIYITTHSYKHFKGSGTGLRSLLDSYVYLWRKKDNLNWDYIAAEVEKLGIAEFEEQSRILAERLFSVNPVTKEEDLTEAQKELFYYCFFSGTYGTREQHINNKLKELQPDEQPLTKKTKLHYYLNRLFPVKNTIRHKWLLPFYWIWRFIRMIFTNRKKIIQEIKLVWKKS